MGTLKERLEKVAPRTERGIDYKQLSRLAGVSVQAVKKWFGIGGSTYNVEMGTLFRLADGLRISARWLATGAGQPRDPTNDRPRVESQKKPNTFPALTPEAAHAGREWAGLDEPERAQILTLIETLHAKKLKAARTAIPGTTRKNEDRPPAT